MEGIKSSVVLFALLLAIFGPTVSFGNKRTCFCETWRHPTGESSDVIRLLDITNPVYRRSLYLGCSSPRSWCPRDCKQNALATLGGSRSSFTTMAGNRVCSIYGRDRPCPGLSVVAKYEVSNCGSRGTLQLASNVCCAWPSFRCSCSLTASVEGRLHENLPLTPYTGARQGPYYDCSEEETIHSDCKNECINHYIGILDGRISPSYELTSANKMCEVLGTILPTNSREPFHSYSAQVNIRYSSGVGDPKTEELDELCCMTVSSVSLTFAVPEC